jgi:hypothetical protein
MRQQFLAAALLVLLVLPCALGDEPPPGAPPTKRIVLACDSTPAYAFYLPLTVRVWEAVAGYSATVLLVGRRALCPATPE